MYNNDKNNNNKIKIITIGKLRKCFKLEWRGYKQRKAKKGMGIIHRRDRGTVLNTLKKTSQDGEQYKK